jgi:hypothetical protein
MEIWKDIKGFEGKYQISNTGKLLIVNYRNSGKSQVANSNVGKDGYHRVYLNVGYTKAYLVHRLVATHFLAAPEIEDKKQVNHIDGNKSNNNVTNLEWVNAYENTAHAIRAGLFNNSGENSGQAVLEESDVVVIRKMLKTGKITQRKLADVFNVSPMTISLIEQGKTWKEIV